MKLDPPPKHTMRVHELAKELPQTNISRRRRRSRVIGRECGRLSLAQITSEAQPPVRHRDPQGPPVCRMAPNVILQRIPLPKWVSE
jgi:hypothetical protein